ncbi:MAG: hypothetical protein RSA50_06630 [Mucinivorans sp.]
MNRLKFTIIALCALMATSVSAQTLAQAGEKFNAAMELAQNKKFTDATPMLEQAMKMAAESGEDGSDALVKEIQGTLPKIYMFSGVMQLKNKEYDQAIEKLLKAEQMADLWGDVNVRRQASRFASTGYQMKGADFFNNKDFAKALEIFTQGYQQDSSNQQLALLTAKTYAELAQMDKAAPIFMQVIETGAANSKFADAAAEAKTDLIQYALIAASEAGKKSDLAAVVTYAGMIKKVAPENAEAPLLLVQLANNLKKYDAVIAHGAEAADAQTDAAKKSDVYLLLGVAYQNKENNAKALECLKKVTSGDGVAQAKALVTELSK